VVPEEKRRKKGDCAGDVATNMLSLRVEQFLRAHLERALHQETKNQPKTQVNQRNPIFLSFHFRQPLPEFQKGLFRRGFLPRFSIFED
jgi:hypothetical protein